MVNSPKRVLAFLAHPDDAEILCAGTLIRLADVHCEIHIATATAGDCGSTTLPADEISKLRRKEATVAAQKIGAVYHCLELLDANVIFDQEANHKAIELFRKIAPSIVFTHPRHDYMLDHEQVHLLSRSASFGFAMPNVTQSPLASGSTIPWLYYCDPIEGSDPYTGELVPSTTSVDITAVIDRKCEMLACHASQREWLRNHHGMDEYLDSMKRHSAIRGQQLGTEYAEAFVQHRGHPFPQSDILHEILGGK